MIFKSNIYPRIRKLCHPNGEPAYAAFDLRSLKLIPIIVFGLLSIIASGGGGSEGDNVDAVTYSGVTTAAKVTPQNANAILSVVLGGGSDSFLNIPLSVIAQGDGTLPASSVFGGGKGLRHLFHAIKPLPQLFMMPLSVAVDQRMPGAVSGSSWVTGNLDADGTGTLTVRFDNFNDGDELTFDGDFLMQISAYEPMYDLATDMLVDIGLLRVSASGGDFSMSGKLRLQTDLTTNMETMSLDMDLRDNLTKKVHRYQGLVWTTLYDDLLSLEPSVVSETISGRVYVQDEGYVDITTASPVQCDGCDEFIPASGGPILLRGDSSEAKVVLVSTEKVRIEIDADGDGEHEDFRVYFWTDLSGDPAPNEAPVAGVPALQPSAAYTTDDLGVDVSTFSDPDGDPLEFSYAWYRDGSLIAGEMGPSLGANNFVKNELITVTVTASDGEFSVTADAPPITILDSPPVLTATPPASVPYGSATVFTITAVDADGDTPVFTVQHGPAGLTVDAVGQVSWTPVQPLFEDRVSVQLAIDVQGGNASAIYSTAITLEDPMRQPPLVRSSPLAPNLGYPDALAVADFDGDGRDEILTTDTRKLLYTLDYRNGAYEQAWVYPFDLPEGGYISVVTAYDLDGGGRPEMLVGAGRRLVVLDGVDRRIIAEIDSPLGMFSDIEVADIDGDGNVEIIALATSDFQSGEHILGVYSADGLTTKWQSVKMNLGDHLAIGNVDQDPQLEVVTSGGYVVDGQSYEIEWSYSGGFGTRVDTGDLDDDGVEEIVASARYSTVRAYSAVTQSRLWQIPEQPDSTTDSGAVLVVNVDDDPQAEVIITDGQWGTVRAYDADAGTPAKKWNLNQIGSGVNSLAIGDTDGDGAIELAWTTGQLSEARLVVADLLPASPWIEQAWINTDTDLLRGPYYGGQWLNVAPGQPQAVFSAITSAPMERYNKTRLVSLDPQTPAVTMSASTGSNNFSYTGVVMDGADIDGDGLDEVFLAFPQPQTGNGNFSVYDFATDAISWNSGLLTAGSQLGRSIIRHADVNGDGSTDFIALVEDNYGGATYLYVYDVGLNTLLWQSAALPGSKAFDLEVADLDGDGMLDIIAATGTPGNALVYLPSGHLSVYEYDTEKAAFISGPTQALPLGGPSDNTKIRLTVGNFDGDGQLEVALSSLSWEEDGAVSEPVIQIRDGLDLSLQRQFKSSDAVSDLLAVAGPVGRNNLLLAIWRDVSLYWVNTSNHVLMVDAISGTEIWRSPPLIGQVQNNSMTLADTNGDGISELILGTSEVMYITR